MSQVYLHIIYKCKLSCNIWITSTSSYVGGRAYLVVGRYVVLFPQQLGKYAQGRLRHTLYVLDTLSGRGGGGGARWRRRLAICCVVFVRQRFDAQSSSGSSADESNVEESGRVDLVLLLVAAQRVCGVGTRRRCRYERSASLELVLEQARHQAIDEPLQRAVRANARRQIGERVVARRTAVVDFLDELHYARLAN